MLTAFRDLAWIRRGPALLHDELARVKFGMAPA